MSGPRPLEDPASSATVIRLAPSLADEQCHPQHRQQRVMVLVPPLVLVLQGCTRHVWQALPILQQHECTFSDTSAATRSPSHRAKPSQVPSAHKSSSRAKNVSTSSKKRCIHLHEKRKKCRRVHAHACTCSFIRFRSQTLCILQLTNLQSTIQL